MLHTIRRRRFLQGLALGTLGSMGTPPAPGQANHDPRDFRISLSQRSLTRTIRAGRLDPLDFAAESSGRFGIDAVDYYSPLFPAHLPHEKLLTEMNKRAAAHNVRQLLIVVEQVGRLGDADAQERARAVQHHGLWIEAAQALGCHGICVNADGSGSRAQQAAWFAESFQRLLEDASRHKINVLITNSGELTADAEWLTAFVEQLDSSLVGTQARFDGLPAEDRYRSMAAFLPTCKSVCATAMHFAEDGQETNLDFFQLMKVVLDGGYRGYVSVEYLGDELDEAAGIQATTALLAKIRATLA